MVIENITNYIVHVFLDIPIAQFVDLKPHHIKELLPNLSERIRFEVLFDKYIKEGIPINDNISDQTLLGENLVFDDIINNNENVLTFDDVYKNPLNHCIVYQNLNVKTSQDILLIQSIDIQVVYKNYITNSESLQGTERLSLARGIIHHLLVSNMERV